MQRWRIRPRRTILAIVGVFMTASFVTITPSDAATSVGWSMGGQSIQNLRYQSAETQLSTSTVGFLHSKWVATMHGDVTATPAVVNGAVYVPDWGGYMSKLDAATGNVIWSVKLDNILPPLTGVLAGGHYVSRTSPAVSGTNVVIGTQSGSLVIDLDAATGALKWYSQADPHQNPFTNPFAIVTQSPVVQAGIVYAGVASSEEAAVAFGWPCCMFRGSESAFDVRTGARLWSVDTIDDASYAAGYRGVGVWGSTPVVDTKRGSLYITTGNDYDAPQSVKDCQSTYVLGTPYHCEDAYPGNHVDSIMAVDLSTGTIKWSTRLQQYDAWNVACIFGTSPDNCPDPAGPDYDFGQGAMLINGGKKTGDVLAAGQKSGFLWGLNPDTGAVRWSYFAGPGSSLGGLEWGSASDGKRIYYAVVNLFGVPYGLTNPAPGSATTTHAGLWGAVDAFTGQPVWQQADPNGTVDLGPVSVANGVVYATSFGGHVQGGDSAGKDKFFALDAATGAIKWRAGHDNPGSGNGGASIVDGSVYWGNGYQNQFLGDPDPHLYSFTS
jgi:polyvinyl alcohol dehydrogenase (cytochrome)